MRTHGFEYGGGPFAGLAVIHFQTMNLDALTVKPYGDGAVLVLMEVWRS